MMEDYTLARTGSHVTNKAYSCNCFKQQLRPVHADGSSFCPTDGTSDKAG